MTNYKKPFLPPHVTALIKRVLVRFCGALLSLLGLFIVIALLSFNPFDPSFNTASTGIVTNRLGIFGAYTADFILQWVGFAGYIFGFALIQWGWITLKYKKINLFCIRFISLFLAVFFTAIFLKGIFKTSGFPVTAGAGGIIGLLSFEQSLRIFPFLKISQDFIPLLKGFFFLLSALMVVFTFDAIGIWQKMVAYCTKKLSRYVQAKLPENISLPLPSIKINNHEPEIERKEGKLKNPAATGEFVPPQAAKASFKSSNSAETEAELNEEPLPDLVERAEFDEPTTKPTKPRRKSGNKDKDGYEFPPLDLLTSGKDGDSVCDLSDDELNANARALEKVLEEFGVKGEIVKVRPGPVVTLYELNPAPGTKTSRVVGLSDDIARSMSAVSVRIAVVPGSNTIGIELPNERRKTVYLKDLLEAPEFTRGKSSLNLVLGKDIGGKPAFADLAKMPHLLIAGTTGSGKSVSVNSMILSVLFKLSPRQCRLIMIDPKMLEFTPYNGIPHLLTPVVTDPGKAVVALKWAVREMEDRYRAMSQMGVRNIDSYNQKLEEASKNGEILKRTVQTGFNPENGQPIYEEQEFDLTPLPYIIVIVDEMADLMMVAGKDVEAAIQRLAQMARAAGIHLIMATQRPSVDVITGTIKANFPTRISFNVTSKIDSRTILGEQGAEQLLGRGDMLYMASGARPVRIHGPFVDDNERDAVISFLKDLGEPEYISTVVDESQPPSEYERAMAAATGGNSGEGGSDDEIYDQAVAIVLSDRKVSTSYIQRRLRIGYNRAAEMVERMEREGLIGPANHVGKREILVPDGQGM